MAIKFPDFLQATLVKPDYSGIGDIFSNYYAGKAMPKDDLIKAVQAQFAKPNAEQDLLSSQLQNKIRTIQAKFAEPLAEQSLESSKITNRKNQFDLENAIRELAIQKQLEQQMKQALHGTSSGMQGNYGSNQPTPILNGNENASSLPYTPINFPINNPPSATNNNLSNLSNSQSQPTSNDLNEIVVSKGSPNLAGIDEMYNNNPLSRAFLEKKGYKKTQSIKFDNKTGKTSIFTTYPSGKITVQTTGSTGGEEGIPLTNKMISKHQNVISSIDVALPTLEKLADPNLMKDSDFSRFSTTNRGAKYNAMVSQVLDSVLGAYGLPQTDKGLESVRAQLQIGHGESASSYRQRIKDLIAELKKRRAYSSEQVKRSNKIQPVGRMSDNSDNTDTSSINDSDPAGVFEGGQ